MGRLERTATTNYYETLDAMKTASTNLTCSIVNMETRQILKPPPRMNCDFTLIRLHDAQVLWNYEIITH